MKTDENGELRTCSLGKGVKQLLLVEDQKPAVCDPKRRISECCQSRLACVKLTVRRSSVTPSYHDQIISGQRSMDPMDPAVLEASILIGVSDLFSEG